MIRKMLLTAAFLLATIVFAQVENSGVYTQTDDFDGSFECYQVVTLDNELGISLINYDNDADLSVMIVSTMMRDFPFNAYGPLSHERVRIRFGNEDIRDLTIATVETDLGGYNTTQHAMMVFGNDYIRYILTYPGEVRVRLDGDNFNYDFVFTEEMRSMLMEFYLECVPNTDGV